MWELLPVTPHSKMIIAIAVSTELFLGPSTGITPDHNNFVPYRCIYMPHPEINIL
jgi:hypothetical protein